MKTITCYIRGGSRGNPGPSAAGVSIVDGEQVVKEVSQKIGNANATYAEYHAVMLALQTLQDIHGDDTQTTAFEIKLDNELVKKQLNGEAEINDPGLVPMFIEIHNMRVSRFPHLTITLVAADANTAAARLVDAALASD